MLRTLLRVVFLLVLNCALPQQGVAQGPLPAPGKDLEYKVQPRDTMIGIARRYLIDGEKLDVQRALWDHNKLKDKDSIHLGQVILIPENWLRNAPGKIVLTQVQGEVQSAGAKPKAGAEVNPGDEVRTGKDGYVTIRLADGSTLALSPDSDLAIEGVRKSPLEGSAAADAKFLLKSGRVEAAVHKRPAGGARFEVRTPIAVAAVRGTQFRVVANGAQHTATSEVLEGVVQVSDTGNRGSVSVEQGYGTQVREGSPPAKPRELLPAPHLWTGIRLWVKRPIRMNFTNLDGAVRYRALVSRTADFNEIVFEGFMHNNKIRLPDLPSGPYFIRVRGIDELGLEGRDADASVVINLPKPGDPPHFVIPTRPNSPDAGDQSDPSTTPPASQDAAPDQVAPPNPDAPAAPASQPVPGPATRPPGGSRGGPAAQAARST